MLPAVLGETAGQENHLGTWLEAQVLAPHPLAWIGGSSVLRDLLSIPHDWVRLGVGRRCTQVPTRCPCPTQDWLLGQMQKAQQRCRQTLFIFDEAEKLHPELLELLRLQLEHRAPEKPDARPQRSIFVFLR